MFEHKYLYQFVILLQKNLTTNFFENFVLEMSFGVLQKSYSTPSMNSLSATLQMSVFFKIDRTENLFG